RPSRAGGPSAAAPAGSPSRPSAHLASTASTLLPVVTRHGHELLYVGRFQGAGMRRPLLLQGILVVTLAGLAAACGDDDPTGPTPGPTPTPITESYTGTLTVNGAVTFAPIVVNQAGSANATIKALTPSALVKVHGGGTGAFSPGETVFQGESLYAATTTGVVHSWNPATGSLHLASVAAGSTFVADTPVICVTSGANWTSAGTSGTIIGMAM